MTFQPHTMTAGMPLMAGTPWHLATRTAGMSSSILRELLTVGQRPGMIALSGGLPAAQAFPCELLRAAADRLLSQDGPEVLQYADSEGYAPLRAWVAEHLHTRYGWRVGIDQVLITHGSQQGLDLVGKVLIDAGSPVRVEAPTYVGALKAFAPMEPRFEAIDRDEDGPLPSALAAGGRLAYLVPNYQNPTGHCVQATRRQDLILAAQQARLPLVEDNPYGELWYDEAPPPPLAAHWPEGVLYLGSFSKVLVPGLRVGYVVTPKALGDVCLQAKQAADLHTSVFNQRLVFELLSTGFIDQHVLELRARYRVQRDAMAQALRQRMPAGCRWKIPAGGMFFWVELPPTARPVDDVALLQAALAQGVAFAPGSAFYAGVKPANQPTALRLSFVTVPPAQIKSAIGRLAQVVGEALQQAQA